jgi:hypothetical protein
VLPPREIVSASRPAQSCPSRNGSAARPEAGQLQSGATPLAMASSPETRALARPMRSDAEPPEEGPLPSHALEHPPRMIRLSLSVRASV